MNMDFGAAYYPEHWGYERIEVDASLMLQANFNIVRMGEFAWTRIQPERFTFNFEWLDDAIKIFASKGIRTILCTPTACPPKYLMDQFPDIYTCDYQGIRKGYGSRRSYCFNSESYIDAVKEIAYELAYHYRNNPNVVAWQIDNELGGDSNLRCYCENCKIKFRNWLKLKYDNIENLNHEWGTEVWSQLYRTFEEIDPPGYTNTVKNPSACLDYKRFCSDSAINLLKLQHDIIRRINPKWKITTNMFGVKSDIDYFEMCKNVDFAGWDDYPNLTLEKITPYNHAMGLDATRCYKHKPFWSVETQTGTPGGDILFQTPRPGDMKKWVFQTIARGANGVMFFRWRTNFMGAEQYWHGILNHDGVPRRLYDEVVNLGKSIKFLSENLDFNIKKAKAAIVFSQEISWAFEIQPLIIGYSYYENAMRYYNATFDNNFNVDIISPEHDYSDYRIIIFPNLLFCKPEITKKIEKFVSNGGTAIFDFRSGVKENNNKMLKETLPCNLKRILGIEIHEYGLIMKHENVQIVGDNYKGEASKWFEIIEQKSADSLANYVCDDYYDSYPAITINKYGSGNAYYLSTMIDENLLFKFINDVFAKSHIHAPAIASCGIELISRTGVTGEILFIINHTKTHQEILLAKSYYLEDTQNKVNQSIVVEGNECIVLCECNE